MESTSAPDVKAKSAFYEALSGLGTALNALTRGPKMRSTMLTGTAGNAFCLLLLCTAIARSGRIGVISASFVWRAAQDLAPSLELTRSLMERMQQASNFNGTD